MAPKLPDRYSTRIRLGKDGDVEEWLATDTSLDRPVLVRILDSRADRARREDFMAAGRGAAAAHHVSLSEVYALGTMENPYLVVEWHGGVSIADRLRAGEALTVEQFLTAGPRLASGLAALHAAGGVHGALDTAAIGFAGGQPAKIGAFGRRRRYGDSRRDTAELAAALRVALTGKDISGLRPSEVAEGLPNAADGILADAERGALSAAAFAASLRALRPAEVPERTSNWSWKWTAVSASLVAAALLVAALGAAIEVDPESPFLFPAVPADAAAPPRVIGDPQQPAGVRALPVAVTGYDPSGAIFPNEDELVLIVDDLRSTGWRTSTHVGTPGKIEPGIGVAFAVEGTAEFVEIVATPGTGYELRYAAGEPGGIVDWDRVAAGSMLEGANTLRVPPRTGGRWLLWLTGLPEREEGRFYADISSVRFLP
jgi:hypothetical protein